MTNSLALTVDDIDHIVEAIEHFVMNGDPELDAIWQPYIDKLLWLRAGIKTVNAPESRESAGQCRGSGMVAYWDGSAYAGEMCRGCIDCEPPDSASIEAQQTINARLIAAAPELLAALTDLLFEDSDKSDAARITTRLKARAAIAKAEGV